MTRRAIQAGAVNAASRCDRGQIPARVGSATPLQHAGIHALQMSTEYYTQLAKSYISVVTALNRARNSRAFRWFVPRGACYVMADISLFGFPDDHSFVSYLLSKAKVAAVSGSSFYAHSRGGTRQIRFCFCKKYETLKLVQHQLKQLV
jgi:aminotransferase